MKVLLLVHVVVTGTTAVHVVSVRFSGDAVERRGLETGKKWLPWYRYKI